MISVRPIQITDAASFREAVDSVCRERRYLASFEAPVFEQVIRFVTSNVTSGFPQIVAEDEDGRIVGWCDAIPGDPCSGTSHVGRLGMGVIREFRGRKIGGQLIEATIAEAIRVGLEKIELSVYSSNLPAIALYQKLGFEHEGTKRRGRLVDGVYEDVYLMALHLNTPDKTVEATPPRSVPHL